MTGKTMEVGIFLCFVYIKKTKILVRLEALRH